MSEQYCNNCGKYGHSFHQCKVPITSVGIIAFRKGPSGEYEFLMIRRKDTLGYIDFMRGKYSVYNKNYIMNMLKQMTIRERECLQNCNFNMAWRDVWGSDPGFLQYKSEEQVSREKFYALVAGVQTNTDRYNLVELIEESKLYTHWSEPEWGFPKGRRNYQEKDYDCALREFSEETGYDLSQLINIHNILPFEEIFTGSNYKSYKHKYYLMYMKYQNALPVGNYDPTEVSKMEWKTFDQCVDSIRGYNLEKRQILKNVNDLLHNYQLAIVR
jgi:8-oxo-dGTP pyrophosphatase MutT (NUDIX family)